jgi:hypothetical protein
VETAAQARADLPLLGAGWSASRWPLHTARQLQEGGVAPGTDIAVIGSGASFAAWARVARLCIVAEVPTRHVATYQGADPAARQAVLDALARAGSRAVVAEFPDGRAPDEGWRLVTDTPLHYRHLAPEATLTDQSGAGGRRTDSHAAWCPARGASRHGATAARVKVIR